MPEYVNYKVNEDGVAIGVTASYVVEVHRPDGTWDRKQASDMENARQIISEIRGGYLKVDPVPEPEPEPTPAPRRRRRA